MSKEKNIFLRNVVRQVETHNQHWEQRFMWKMKELEEQEKQPASSTDQRLFRMEFEHKIRERSNGDAYEAEREAVAAKKAAGASSVGKWQSDHYYSRTHPEPKVFVRASDASTPFCYSQSAAHLVVSSSSSDSNSEGRRKKRRKASVGSVGVIDGVSSSKRKSKDSRKKSEKEKKKKKKKKRDN
eukprot:GHVR01108778.1.p1 GENE.GHVR01108778.1~~GHVR01108778.1.p1  ORF type:complete len:184 (+),score=21.67 GHVR01108778.1:13-564(+)